MLLVGFYRTILTLSMRAFGPRISAYAFWTTTDIHTYIPTDIPREISIEHPSVGLASLAQIFNPSEWNIGIYCTQGSNISRGRRPRKIFSTEGNICRYFTRKGFEYLVYYIGYSLRGTTVSVATYPLTMLSIRGGTLGWNIEIYSTPTNQFDWSVSRAYVINIYISREISIEHPSVGLCWISCLLAKLSTMTLS